MLAEENPEIKRNIIIFPFSGSPNSVRPNNLPNNNDIVTSENLAHLKKRLRGHGLMADNPELLTKETYFVDCIASGSGPAYTIETILRDFQEQGVKETPKFKIIALNEFTFEDDDPRNESIASKEAKDGEELTLSFPSKREIHFEIPAQVIYMPGHGTFDNLPDQFTFLRMLPKYNAAFWKDEFEHIIASEPTFIQRLLIEHFDINIKARIKEDI